MFEIFKDSRLFDNFFVFEVSQFEEVFFRETGHAIQKKKSLASPLPSVGSPLPGVGTWRDLSYHTIRRDGAYDMSTFWFILY